MEDISSTDSFKTCIKKKHNHHHHHKEDTHNNHRHYKSYINSKYSNTENQIGYLTENQIIYISKIVQTVCHNININIFDNMMKQFYYMFSNISLDNVFLKLIGQN